MVESVQKRYMDFSSVKLKFKYIRRKICIYIGIGIGQNDFENIGISNIGQNPISCIPICNNSRVFTGLIKYANFVYAVSNRTITIMVTLYSKVN